MPGFTPSGTIRIGRVPFDNSYAHTMTFGSASAQQAYFAGVCTQALSQSDYTYVRLNSSIRVPFNAESLYTYNYCMYQNSNYGSKWFYAFITDIQYVNSKTTELTLEIDVMQTWYFDYELEPCFVEREHVSSDRIGEHTNPEPAMGLEYEAKNLTECTEAMRWIVVQTTEVPSYIENTPYTEAQGTDSVNGIVVERTPQGCKYLLFDRANSGSMTAFKHFMAGMQAAGGADGIAGMFLYPDEFGIEGAISEYTLPHPPAEGLGGTVYQLNDAEDIRFRTFTSARPTTFGSFTPHNKKLYSYPYQMIQLSDFNGSKKDFKYELLSNPAASSFTTQVYVNMGPDTMQYAFMRDYNAGFANPITVDVSVPVSWTYDVYANWIGQNKTAVAMTLAGSVISAVIGVVPGLAGAAGVYSQGAPAHLANGQHFANRAAVRAGETLADEVSLGGVAGGIAGIAGTLANVDRMQRQPNEVRGAAGGSLINGAGLVGYMQYTWQLREEYARIVDGFFDMYGYAVDSVKVPNRTGRPHWNYVKCANACMHGNVPAADMALINSIYNAGVTFWHDANVGDYTQDNTL